MKNIVPTAFVFLLAASAAGPALAQGLSPAPVPNRAMDNIAPSERVGRPDGSERAAPFSGLPNTVGAGTGQDTPITTNQERTGTAPTPSLSR